MGTSVMDEGKTHCEIEAFLGCGGWLRGPPPATLNRILTVPLEDPPMNHLILGLALVPLIAAAAPPLAALFGRAAKAPLVAFEIFTAY